MKVLLLVIDGFGLGAFPDALNRSVEIYGKIIKNAKLPNFAKLGLYNINNPKSRMTPMASYGNLRSVSLGTDVITLYFELAGLHIKSPYPTYPKGLPQDLLQLLEKKLKTNIIGNIVVDGSKLINDLGALHYNTGFPIVYTSSKSIMYMAAHEDIISTDKLYNFCELAREVMTGKNNIARIMASPFSGNINNFKFTEKNKCYTIKPSVPTMLDVLKMRGIEVSAIGKISEIFNATSFDNVYDTNNNEEIFEALRNILNSDYEGLVFANIETADLSRNDDVKVYTKCVEEIDKNIGKFIKQMNSEDLLILTSNHTYELPDNKDKNNYTIPMMIYGGKIKPNINLGTIDGLYSVSHTILDYYNIKGVNKSFINEVLK